MTKKNPNTECTGTCLCGAVSYASTADPAIVGHCYCVDCRKSSGTGHGTHVAIAEDACTIHGDCTEFAHPADSGNIVTRMFCPVCGSPVYSTNSAMPGMLFFRASSLDDLETIQPSIAVYTSRAPSWDKPDPALPSFPEMPDGGAEKAVTG